MKNKKYEKLFYDLNKNRPQIKTPEKDFHSKRPSSRSIRLATKENMEYPYLNTKL